MSFLLSEPLTDPPEDSPCTDILYIENEPHSNTAAKFWPSLIDEVRKDHPDCRLIRLSAPTSEKLTTRHLTPKVALDDDLEKLLDADMQAVMEDALAEIKILGPPAGVHVQLLAGATELLSKDLPLDCVDAALLPYLLVWPLTWADIPDSQWNDDSVAGEFVAEDRQRELTYRISFTLEKTPLSEGLFVQSITLSATVSG